MLLFFLPPPKQIKNIGSSNKSRKRRKISSLVKNLPSQVISCLSDENGGRCVKIEQQVEA